MTWAAVAVGAGSIVAGYLGSQSSKKAAGAAAAGSQEAIDEARRQFNLVRGDTAGQRLIGNGATNTLARLYGYGPTNTTMSVGDSGAPLYQAPPLKEGGYFNEGNGKYLNPWTVTGKLPGAAKVFDPAGALVGNLFGGTHGDEKRNLKAFTSENKIYDLGDGKLALEDGTTFDQSQLKDLAGTYYGAKYAPDGNQQEWQSRYTALLGGLPKAPGSGPVTIDNATGAVTTSGTPGKPDMSAFFESPDYQFRLNEGQKAVDRSASARGGVLSGGAQREGVRYASSLASGEFGSFVDRLMQQAGLGSTGIGASAAAGANTAANVGNAAITGANARGSAYLTSANSINNSVQGGISNLLLSRYLGG